MPKACLSSLSLESGRAARGFRFGDKDAVPVLCECADDACQQFMPVTLHAYEALLETREWLLAARHVADTIEPPPAP